MGFYIEKKELARAVRESKSQGRMTDELAGMVVLIARHYCRRYRFACSTDDAIQNAALAVLRVLERLDPRQNLFSYISQIIGNELRGEWRAEWRQAKVRAGLRKRLEDKGRGL
jgi:DNA-directed RNA polymerase specialized sigma subunit